MSGGSLDYLYIRVEEVAERLKDKNNTPLQRAFGEHLCLVASALHDIEWCWSLDYGKGDDEDAIKKVLNHNSSVKNHLNLIIRSDASDLLEQLKSFLEQGIRNQDGTTKE